MRSEGAVAASPQSSCMVAGPASRHATPPGGVERRSELPDKIVFGRDREGSLAAEWGRFARPRNQFVLSGLCGCFEFKWLPTEFLRPNPATPPRCNRTGWAAA